MELKIKEGAVIAPYGPQSNSFTSESELSQDVLAHLQSRFPEEIEGELEAEEIKEPVKGPKKKVDKE